MREPTVTRRGVVATSIAGLTAGLAGCSEGSAGADHTVTVGPDGDTSFAPEELTVSAGDTVRFEWDSGGHNVNPQSQPDGADWAGETEIGDADTTHEHTFEVAGTYEYQCDPHVSAGMVGTIVVEE